MFQVLFFVFTLSPFIVSGYAGEYDPAVYSRSYASPSGNTFGYAYASAGSPGGLGTYASSGTHGGLGGFSGYRGRTYSSGGSSHPYSSGYYSSSSSNYGSGRPYSSYSSYSSQCSYEDGVITENGVTRPMSDYERQLVRSYERDIMNYNSNSVAAIAKMNLRFMEQIQDGLFPTLFPYETLQMPQPPCLCSSCRGGSSRYRSNYGR